MAVELSYLIWSAGVGLVYLGTQALLYRRQIGIAGAITNRDNDPAPDLWSDRGARALRNFYETYGFFVALAVATLLSGGSDWMTQWGCHLYFWSRVVYLPLYIFGIGPIRGLVWIFSLAGLILLFVGALV